MGGERRGHRGTVRTAAALALGGLLVACGGGDPPADPPYSVRDSAGITVVENNWGTMWAPEGAWLVDSEPVLTLGTLDGPEETQFYDVAEARLRDDGAVVVLDGGNARVLAFGSDGRFLWSQGRDGEGPGEYQRAQNLLVLPGDSVLVYDSGARRVTVLGPEGGMARDYTPVPPEGALMNAPMALVADGLTLSTSGAMFGDLDGGTTGRAERPAESFILTDTRGAPVDTLGSLPGREMWMVANEQFVSVRSLPFAKRAVADGAAGRIVLAVTDRPEWRILDASGAVTRIVRLAAEPPEVTPADWDRARDASIPEDADAEVRNRVMLEFEEMSRPDRWPAFSDLLLDDQGHLWVQRFAPPWEEDGPASWWVFNPDGILLGEVALPTRFEVDQIRGDRIVGRWEDDLGVQQVRVYRVVGRGG
jgi:hypothetical protein